MSKVDLTGSIAQMNMMGYATPYQNAAGIHGRLYARTFYAKDRSLFILQRWPTRQRVQDRASGRPLHSDTFKVLLS